MTPREITTRLVKELEPLRFGPPVAAVYNPLVYARACHDAYVERYARRSCEVVLLGMNPGPFGMAQTGVPFGEISMVRDWLGICEDVGRPDREHPKRPITGFGCTRSEVSGSRLWGFAKEHFGTPDRFFDRFFIANYCPLVFMEESGANRTPDKLPASEREPLFAACDRALLALVEYLGPTWVIGVGTFAEARAKAALQGTGVKVGRILHPSPASPAANRGWAEAVRGELEALGIALPAKPRRSAGR
ncbi:MAG: uracil-DNA glycosylase family protein [Myxococcales bacterium]